MQLGQSAKKGNLQPPQPKWVAVGLESEVNAKCLKPAFSLMAWLQKEVLFMEVYEKMTLLLT